VPFAHGKAYAYLTEYNLEAQTVKVRFWNNYSLGGVGTGQDLYLRLDVYATMSGTKGDDVYAVIDSPSIAQHGMLILQLTNH
jgi:hypothetical protein